MVVEMDVKTGLITSLVIAAVVVIAAVEIYDGVNPVGAEVNERRLCEFVIAGQTVILVILLAIW